MACCRWVACALVALVVALAAAKRHPPNWALSAKITSEDRKYFEYDPNVTPIVYAVSASVYLMGKHLQCPEGMVPMCPRKCEWYTCTDVKHWEPCQVPISTCSADELRCECDYVANYFWNEQNSQCEQCNKLKDGSQKVDVPSYQCGGGRVLTCVDCETDSCDIFWNSTAHCKIVTESCQPKFCRCNNEAGWFWDPSSKACVTKAACVKAIDCSKEIIASEPFCNLGSCKPTCRDQCLSEVADAATCTKKPECMCPEGLVEMVDPDDRRTRYCELIGIACDEEESCTTNAVLKCNDQNCKQRTFEDFKNNVTYEECTFGSIENCPEKHKECWCENNYMKTEDGECRLTEKMVKEIYHCPPKALPICITEACPKHSCGKSPNKICTNDKTYRCTLDTLYCYCGVVKQASNDRTACVPC